VFCLAGIPGKSALSRGFNRTDGTQLTLPRDLTLFDFVPSRDLFLPGKATGREEATSSEASPGMCTRRCEPPPTGWS